MFICKTSVVLHWLPRVRTSLRREMEQLMVMSRQEVKDIVLDVVRNVVIAMGERVKAAEERAQNPFAYRTNIYRCEDGRPICYCCLRVGHVTKYCRDRMYSCPHNKAMERGQVAFPTVRYSDSSIFRQFDIPKVGQTMLIYLIYQKSRKISYSRIRKYFSAHHHHWTGSSFS